MIADQYTDGTYLEKVGDWHQGDSPWKAGKVYQMMKKNSLSPHSVADIGCGTGGILAELQARLPEGSELTGYDISPQAIEIAKEKENEHLRFVVEDYFSASVPTPDLLLLLDVFEHVPNYLGFLEELRKKSSWVIFHIPLDLCAKEVVKRSGYMIEMRSQYGHLHYFTKETALVTLSDVGFRIVDHFYTDDEEMSIGKSGGSVKQRLMKQARKQIFRFKQDLSVAIFNGYNMMVLARGDLGVAIKPV